jgi:integrase
MSEPTEEKHSVIGVAIIEARKSHEQGRKVGKPAYRFCMPCSHSGAIPGKHAKDRENRRIPFDPEGRLAPILKRRKSLGPSAFVFGSPAGEYVDSFKTAWESLLLVANGHDTKRAKHGARVDREKLRQIDLHWHDLRHEGACRLLSDGVDIRTIQLMLGHADIKQTQRYLNITDEELRKAMTGVWERRRQLRAVGQ